MPVYFQIIAMSLVSALIFNGCSSSRVKYASSADEIRQLSKEAYLFGFPLVLMETTRQIATAVPSVTDFNRGPNKAPLNQVAHWRSLPDENTVAIKRPGVDTLISTAWLDLSTEAVVLSVPDAGKRYYQISLLDGWGNVFFAPGTRTTGNLRKSFALVGPQWQGKLPEGVEMVTAPTNIVFMHARTSLSGPNDYAGARYVQDRYKLTPLREWGQGYTPPLTVEVAKGVDSQASPPEKVFAMGSLAYLDRLSELMKKNPPAPSDAEVMNRLTRIGILRGKSFDPTRFSPEALAALNEGQRDAQEELKRWRRNSSEAVAESWVYSREQPLPENEWIRRAVVALTTFGSHLDEDFLALEISRDVNGKEFTGQSRYRMHFSKEELPPVRAFWSLTVYDSQLRLVKTPIRRFALNSQNKLSYNRDGSLDVFFQNKSPQGTKPANWLPTPVGPFKVVMRLYWPQAPILERHWKMPAIQRLSAPPKMSQTAWLENF